ncbi:hypothetical protein COLO4_36343 [Corchorus olitorius]|uniref:DUF4283 domain-containing protein n=1 Tax=Corchorus olitorius TaxID=93759 RepID=A0A1R3G9N1_9ROSI|nr:hypothetical protein COLO4_36343 [Corchorus olitorius]
MPRSNGGHFGSKFVSQRWNSNSFERRQFESNFHQKHDTDTGPSSCDRGVNSHIGFAKHVKEGQKSKMAVDKISPTLIGSPVVGKGPTSGSSKENSEVFTLFPQIPKDDMKWIDRSAVGTLHTYIHHSSVQSNCDSSGISCYVRPLGGKSVLLTFESKDVMNFYLKEHESWFSIWFSSVQACDGSISYDEHMIWLTLESVPLQLWHDSFFMEIDSKLIEDSSPSMQDVEAYEVDNVKKSCYYELDDVGVCLLSRDGEEQLNEATHYLFAEGIGISSSHGGDLIVARGLPLEKDWLINEANKSTREELVGPNCSDGLVGDGLSPNKELTII